MILFSIIDKNGDVETMKTSQTKLTVGGADTDDITLFGGDISPEHGVFHIEDTEVVYTDNGYGTLVNDQEVLGESIPVSSGDSIVIGPVVLTYTLENEDTVPARHIPSFKSDIIKVSESNFAKPIQYTPHSYLNPKVLPNYTRSPAEPTPSGMPSSPEDSHSRSSHIPAEGTYTYLSPTRMKKVDSEALQKAPLIKVRSRFNLWRNISCIDVFIIILALILVIPLILYDDLDHADDGTFLLWIFVYLGFRFFLFIKKLTI